MIKVIFEKLAKFFWIICDFGPIVLGILGVYLTWRNITSQYKNIILIIFSIAIILSLISTIRNSYIESSFNKLLIENKEISNRIDEKEDKNKQLILDNKELAKQIKDLNEIIKNITESTNIISQQTYLYQREGVIVPFGNEIEKSPIYKYYFNNGINRYIDNKYNEAIDQFNKALDMSILNIINPEKKVSAYTFLGNCFYNTGNTEKANKYYNDALTFAKI